jgi:hypothetical protein
MTSSPHAAHISRHRPGTLTDISSDFMSYVGTRISAPADGYRPGGNSVLATLASRCSTPDADEFYGDERGPIALPGQPSPPPTKGADTNVEEAGSTKTKPLNAVLCER